MFFLLILHPMKPVSAHIICFAIFLLSAFPVCAQERNADNLGDKLEQYESLCRTCLNLKQRIASGENVSRSEAKMHIDDFVAMNKELQSVEADMTVVQRLRFSAISSWFSTGVEPQETDTALPQLSCTLAGKSLVATTGSHAAIAEVPSMQAGLPAHRYVEPRRNLILMSSFALPDFSCGLIAGYQYGRWGGYAGFRSNYVSAKTSYSCLSDGSLPDWGSMWSTGRSRKSNLSITAGCLIGLGARFSMYVGTGYGWRTLAWEDVDGEWAEISDWSHRGVAFETGAIFIWKRLAVSAGISTVSFRTCSLNVGVGVSL